MLAKIRRITESTKGCYC